MKKVLVLLLTLTMAITVGACGETSGGEETPAAEQTAQETPAEEEAEVAEVAELEDGTDAEEELTFELDYDALAEWIYGGYLGQTDDGAPALLAINEDATVAIAIFADNDTMEAVSFVGEITDNGDGTVTIADDVSGLTFTFGFEEAEGGQYLMDMGEELGNAVLAPVEREELLTALSDAIQNYTHVA